MSPDKNGNGNGNSHRPVSVGTIGSSRSNSLHSSPSLAADNKGNGSATAPPKSAAATDAADLGFSGLDIGGGGGGVGNGAGNLALDKLSGPEPVPF